MAGKVIYHGLVHAAPRRLNRDSVRPSNTRPAPRPARAAGALPGVVRHFALAQPVSQGAWGASPPGWPAASGGWVEPLQYHGLQPRNRGL